MKILYQIKWNVGKRMIMDNMNMIKANGPFHHRPPPSTVETVTCEM